ncbi:ABC-F family ATP-binding cassette domain-containing protein [candidate division KSB1 bacterium]|nr:ABC-F family ATP-binding cassette domain-containing protein [candidate division KSB1 bacterium]
MKEFLNVSNLSFTYENNIEPIFSSVSFQLQAGWTGIVGANGGGKTTLVKLLTGELSPASGIITFQGTACYCEQRADFIPPDYEKFYNSTDRFVFQLKKFLNFQDDWPSRWDTLSYGERKRLQLAIALAKQPSVLAVDEPTNHLDHSSKQIIIKSLKLYKSIGLLISHDRELLDSLCTHTLFIFPPDIDLRRCAYSTAAEEIDREKHYQQFEYEKTKKEVKRLRKRVIQQRNKAGKADKLKSKRNIHIKDHDKKAKMDQARLTGKDRIEGDIQKRLNSRLERAQKIQNSFGIKKTFQGGISFPVNRAHTNFPVFIPKGSIQLGKKKYVEFPELVINFGEKIGIIGDNGSGKSSFIRYILKKKLIPKNNLIYIPQEIDINESSTILKRIQEYDNDTKGQIMTIIRRLGSDPFRVLDTIMPSPGEVRKLLLAEGIMLDPGLIFMDEPTNHMDVFSIQHIESALQECPCSQLLVSHDFVFLKHTVTYYWKFQQYENNRFRIVARDVV